MPFGHIVVEGYCFHDDESKDVPCSGTDRMSEICLVEKCRFFSWYKAKNLIIMTDSEGNGIRSRIYPEDQQKKIEDTFFLHTDEDE